MKDEAEKKDDSLHAKQGFEEGRHVKVGMLVDSTDSQCDDNCKSCQHWSSEQVFCALYSIHFATDEFLTAALTETAIAVSYRCPSCRYCNSCQDGDSLELRSMNEEREQSLIQKSAIFDPVKGRLTATQESNEHLAKIILTNNWLKVKKKDMEG